MKTLIVYQSTHGCTEKCVEKLKAGLSGDVDVVNLKSGGLKEVSQYETIIVGGSIHAGRIQGKVKRFCSKHEETLLTKKLGLFICCMEEEKDQEEFDANYPEVLRDHATASGIFGGEFDYDRMGFVAKAIIKKVAGTTESVSRIREDAISKFVEEMQ